MVQQNNLAQLYDVFCFGNFWNYGRNTRILSFHPTVYNVLYVYNADDNQWSFPPIKNDKDFDERSLNHNSIRMCLIGGTAVKLNEQYICIIGGYSGYDDHEGHHEMSGNIVLFDLETYTFKMSPMELTMDEFSDCAMLRDRKMESILIVGYIRTLYETAAFDAVSVVPVHVVDLISNWVPIEYIHLHDRNLKPSDAHHVRISLSEILDGAFEVCPGNLSDPNEDSS